MRISQFMEIGPIKWNLGSSKRRCRLEAPYKVLPMVLYIHLHRFAHKLRQVGVDLVEVGLEARIVVIAIRQAEQLLRLGVQK